MQKELGGNVWLTLGPITRTSIALGSSEAAAEAAARHGTSNNVDGEELLADLGLEGGCEPESTHINQCRVTLRIAQGKERCILFIFVQGARRFNLRRRQRSLLLSQRLSERCGAISSFRRCRAPGAVPIRRRAYGC